MHRKYFALALFSLLASCGGGDDVDAKLTQTRMDDLDQLKGTISDELPNIEELNEAALTESAETAFTKPKPTPSTPVDARPVASGYEPAGAANQPPPKGAEGGDAE